MNWYENTEEVYELMKRLTAFVSHRVTDKASIRDVVQEIFIILQQSNITSPLDDVRVLRHVTRNVLSEWTEQQRLLMKVCERQQQRHRHQRAKIEGRWYYNKGMLVCA